MPIPTHYILTLEIPRSEQQTLAERIAEEWNLSVIQLERPGHDRAWLEMYFEQREQADIAAMVMKSWPGVAGWQIRAESPREWQTFWRHHFHATDIGQHLRIVPVWEKDQVADSTQRKTIWLDPGLSFGTGDHFTTRFCLEMIDRLASAHRLRAMLDIGTGSSILAMAARLLGIPNVTGTDHDAIALEQARENLVLNNLEGSINLKVADILNDPPPKGTFDLVCANVYTAILIEIAPVVTALAKRFVVVSGIRDPELDLVAAAYAAQGWDEFFRDGNGEWGGLAFQRKAKDGK